MVRHKIRRNKLKGVETGYKFPRILLFNSLKVLNVYTFFYGARNTPKKFPVQFLWVLCLAAYRAKAVILMPFISEAKPIIDETFFIKALK